MRLANPVLTVQCSSLNTKLIDLERTQAHSQVFSACIMLKTLGSLRKRPRLALLPLTFCYNYRLDTEAKGSIGFRMLKTQI